MGGSVQFANRHRGAVGLLSDWAGDIVSMDQAWYVGPIAKMVGEDGCDLGIWVGVSWAMQVYPPL